MHKSLEHIFRLVSVLNETKQVGEKDLLDFHRFVRRDIPPNERRITDEVIANLFRIGFIKNLPESLSKRKSQIRRPELLTYCQFLHPFILKTISDTHYQQGIIARPLLSNENLERFEEVINSAPSLPLMLNQLEDETRRSAGAFLTLTSLYSQTTILGARKNYDDEAITPNKFFLIHEFSNKYVEKLIRGIYPDWYSASFLLDARNSAIWEYYGDNHKGVCLMFRPAFQNNTPHLNLRKEYGYSSNGEPSTRMQPQNFLPIDYKKLPTEIDFFRSIGRLSKFELNRMWYKDSEGNTSVCGQHLIENEEEWKNQYWDHFQESITIKLSEWQYEKEYRLVIDGNSVDYSDPRKRKLKYDFNQLEGIIFGINTSAADKIRIMKIIEDKCRTYRRPSFKFFQAYYDRETGQIATFESNSFKAS